MVIHSSNWCNTNTTALPSPALLAITRGRVGSSNGGSNPDRSCSACVSLGDSNNGLLDDSVSA